MHQLKVREIIHKYLLLYHDNYPITAEPNAANGSAERKLPNAPSLVVIPDHDLVGRVLRVGPTANESQYVAAEEHLYVADPSAVELAAEKLPVRVAVVDAEAVVSGGGEAGLVLVKG